MKLLTKYSRVNLFSTLIIFILSGIAFYFSLNLIFTRQIDDDLREEKREVEAYVQQYNRLPDPIPNNDQITTFEQVPQWSNIVSFSFVEQKGSEKDETETFRTITFYTKVGPLIYRASVSESSDASETLMKTIIIVSVATILIVLLTNILINRQILKKIWKPFYNSLDQIKSYKPGKSIPRFSETNVDEFEVLNNTLDNAVANAEREFRSLKEFTENASHEMQTPLAVIRSKMDVLIQDEALSESQSVVLQGMYEAVRRLARLNQSMLLLHKIENNLFEKNESLNFRALTENKIAFFKELMQTKELSLTTTLQDVSVYMNAELADILLNNLFSNAVRHTKNGGGISIILEPGKFIIANSSDSAALNDDKIFSRFYKNDVGPERHGLGLAIAEQICIVSGFKIGYYFTEQEHRFAVFFKTA